MSRKHLSDGIGWLAFVAVAGIAILQSAGGPESAWLPLGCAATLLGLSVLARGKAWTSEAFVLAFLLCLPTANQYVTDFSAFSDGLYAYRLRPAPLLVALGCIALSVSPRPEDRGGLRSWHILLIASSFLLGVALLCGYAILSRHYALDSRTLLDALGNLAILAGGLLLVRGSFSGDKQRVSKVIIVLSLLGAGVAHFAGGRL